MEIAVLGVFFLVGRVRDGTTGPGRGCTVDGWDPEMASEQNVSFYRQGLENLVCYDKCLNKFGN
jgi:hypothetical protein